MSREWQTRWSLPRALFPRWPASGTLAPAAQMAGAAPLVAARLSPPPSRQRALPPARGHSGLARLAPMSSVHGSKLSFGGLEMKSSCSHEHIRPPRRRPPTEVEGTQFCEV